MQRERERECVCVCVCFVGADQMGGIEMWFFLYIFRELCHGVEALKLVSDTLENIDSIFEVKKYPERCWVVL